MQDMAKTQLIIRGGAFGFAVQVKAGANNKLGIKSSTMILLSLFFWMLIHKVQGKKKTPTKYNLLLKQKLTMHLAGLPLKLELYNYIYIYIYIYAILSDQ
jgi:hypothetical protein